MNLWSINTIGAEKILYYYSIIDYIQYIFKNRPDMVKELAYPQTRQLPEPGVISIATYTNTIINNNYWSKVCS